MSSTISSPSPAHPNAHFEQPNTSHEPATHPGLQEKRQSTRNTRKHRYYTSSPTSNKPRASSSQWSKIRRMAVIEYWNISWWVAMAFTVGSIIWVINGFIVYLPFVNSRFTTDADGGGWTAWVGATVFEVGSIMMMWEAWNRNVEAYFGRSIRGVRGAGYARHSQDTDTERPFTTLEQGISKEDANSLNEHGDKWIWFSTDRKYLHEIGFLAALIQLCGASVFWVSGVTGLPTIQEAIKMNTALIDTFYWTPQVVGGSGFIISGILLMIETQKKWYIPAPHLLGWHVGFWNFLGGIGFTLCGAFGFSTMSWAMYQSTLSTFWGGWAFLIGSLVQWYEAVNPA
ncbi:hypothetical protein SISSUDRAFT_1042305 [Sistotremastrum suecicum HHB10207 ss-3]|uniref:Integral membrane protein n=1 Tax=Sistotremastrum suecicum HHB10207 ss-3 TaxID=1314776 RepID=A0A166GLE1_9AGAM|nr:hypothetical protein SISSUDRAFT_1042305 [Sistotremastrum suecicum HHB10207 ss-3]